MCIKHALFESGAVLGKELTSSQRTLKDDPDDNFVLRNESPRSAK
jgi:hypothetical protein